MNHCYPGKSFDYMLFFSLISLHRIKIYIYIIYIKNVTAATTNVNGRVV